MALDTVSDPVLRLALWAGLGALAAGALMLFAVLALRLRHGARMSRQRAFEERWHAVLARCAAGEPQTPPKLRGRDAYLFLALWNRMHESLRGEAKEHLNALARALGMDRVALGFLRSGSLRRELMAVLTLGNLRDPAALPALADLLPQRSPVLSLRAAQAVLRIDPHRALPKLLEGAAQRVDWPAARVISLLREAEPEAVGDALARCIDDSRAHRDAPQRLPRLLRLVEAAQAATLRSAVLRTLQAAGDAETIAAALAALRQPQDVEFARRYALHPQWHVRLEAANALGRLGTREDLHRLVALLRDSNWWVRYRAAQAIAALPWASASQLERVMRSVADRFAADALRQALAERRGP